MPTEYKLDNGPLVATFRIEDDGKVLFSAATGKHEFNLEDLQAVKLSKYALGGGKVNLKISYNKDGKTKKIPPQTFDPNDPQAAALIRFFREQSPNPEVFTDERYGNDNLEDTGKLREYNMHPKMPGTYAGAGLGRTLLIVLWFGLPVITLPIMIYALAAKRYMVQTDANGLTIRKLFGTTEIGWGQADRMELTRIRVNDKSGGVTTDVSYLMKYEVWKKNGGKTTFLMGSDHGIRFLKEMIVRQLLPESYGESFA